MDKIMITFIGLKRRSSGKIRGKQIAENIKSANFFDHSEVLKNLNKIHKIVIVVRNRNIKIEKYLKNKGHILGYDILDSAGSDFYFRNKSPDYNNFIDRNIFSFYIVNNTVGYDQVKGCIDNNENVYIIPHHHLNFKKERSYFGEDKIKTAGYVGLPEQFTHQQEIKNILKKNKIDLITNPGHTLKESRDTLSKIQLGVTYMDAKFKKVFESCKPNTKLSNFQSFGVVTLCNENYSFVEFGDDAYLKHNSLDEFEKNLQKIIKNKELRKSISDKGYDNSKRFHIEKIKSLYNNIIEGILK